MLNNQFFIVSMTMSTFVKLVTRMSMKTAKTTNTFQITSVYISAMLQRILEFVQTRFTLIKKTSITASRNQRLIVSNAWWKGLRKRK
jgi:hypothetical protein